MAPQRSDKSPITSIPKLDVIVPAAGGDGESVWGKRDVIDWFLVAEETGNGFCGLEGSPEVDREVVGGGDEAFGYLVVYDRCFCESLFGI